MSVLKVLNVKTSFRARAREKSQKHWEFPGIAAPAHRKEPQQPNVVTFYRGSANYSTVNTPILLTYLLTYPTHNESPTPV